ncbi:hypothetical protein HNQ56_000960 [Anaerotaenia torta]|uniref:hypothetical protein n=1 Tax=Anaerotaenia torta TaxID=433293 RepID=UPI003D21B386
MTCIGYIGEEAYDLVLYIGRTLAALNRRILIIDMTRSGAMTNALHHGMDLDSDSGIIHYRGINYIRRVPSSEEMELYETGVILAVFGYDYNQELFPCNRLIAVTNTFPHIVDKINLCINEAELPRDRLRLLIRDVVSADDVEQVKKRVSFAYEEEPPNYLYLELTDYLCAVRCQETQTVNFENISQGMKNYILCSIRQMLPELGSVRIKRAMHLARKGR